MKIKKRLKYKSTLPKADYSMDPNALSNMNKQAAEETPAQGGGMGAGAALGIANGALDFATSFAPKDNNDGIGISHKGSAISKGITGGLHAGASIAKAAPGVGTIVGGVMDAAATIGDFITGMVDKVREKDRTKVSRLARKEYDPTQDNVGYSFGNSTTSVPTSQPMFGGQAKYGMPLFKDGGKVEPIYVDNPNDPRLKAYQDSSSLYEKYNKKAHKFNKNDLILDTKVPKKTLDLYKENGISPIGMFNTEGYPIGFKKPTQPVIYKKKEEVKVPIPINRNTKESVSPERLNFVKQPSTGEYTVYDNGKIIGTSKDKTINTLKREYALGGDPRAQSNIEAEQGEAMQHSSGKIENIEGQKHENGGTPLQVQPSHEYIYSDSLGYDREGNMTLDENLVRYSFADTAKKIERKYKGRENDSIVQKTKKLELGNLKQDAEQARVAKEEIEMGKQMKKYKAKYGANLKRFDNSGNPQPSSTPQPSSIMTPEEMKKMYDDLQLKATGVTEGLNQTITDLQQTSKQLDNTNQQLQQSSTSLTKPTINKPTPQPLFGGGKKFGNSEWLDNTLNWEATSGIVNPNGSFSGHSTYGINDSNYKGGSDITKAKEYYQNIYLPNKFADLNSLPEPLQASVGDFAINHKQDPRLGLMQASGIIDPTERRRLYNSGNHLTPEIDKLWNDQGKNLTIKYYNEGPENFLGAYNDIIRNEIYPNTGNKDPKLIANWQARRDNAQKYIKNTYNPVSGYQGLNSTSSNIPSSNIFGGGVNPHLFIERKPFNPSRRDNLHEAANFVGKPKPKKTGPFSSLTTGDKIQLSSILPAFGFNMDMGLRKADVEPNRKNPYENEVLSMMANRKFDPQHYLNQANLATNTAKEDIGNNSTSVGVKRANLQKLYANQLGTLGDITTKGQEMNNQYRAEEANTKNIIGEANRAESIRAAGINDQNKARKQQFLAKAFEQLGQGIATTGQSANQSLTNKLLIKSLSEISPDFDVKNMKDMEVDNDGYIVFKGQKTEFKMSDEGKIVMAGGTPNTANAAKSQYAPKDFTMKAFPNFTKAKTKE